MIPKTEYYSLLEPEVKVPEDPRGNLNQAFLSRLLSYDRVYVAGQAKSHCVLETLASIVRHVGDSPEMLGKLRLLEDGTSSVTHPEIDFEAMALEALGEYEAKGLRRVGASDPLD
jgi:nicotinamidase-related amidase